MDFYKSFRLANIFTNLFTSKKVSKILLFILLFGLIAILFSGKVLAVDENEFTGFTEIPWTNFIDRSISSGVIVNDPGHNMQYFHLDSNYIYKIYNSSNNMHSFYYTTIEPDIGVTASFYINLAAGEVQTIPGNSNFYLNANAGMSEFNNYKVYRCAYRGSDGVIQEVTDHLTLNNLWSQIGFVVPLIGVAVLFVVGFIVFKKLSGGSSKGKVKF